MGDSGYKALVKHVGGWWIGWVGEVAGVNTLEQSEEELLSSLREARREALECDRNDAQRAAESDYAEEPLAL